MKKQEQKTMKQEKLTRKDQKLQQWLNSYYSKKEKKETRLGCLIDNHVINQQHERINI